MTATRDQVWRLIAVLACMSPTARCDDRGFPDDFVRIEPHPGNPVFAGAGPGHWDERIRERGWILKEGNEYRMWYTGYSGQPGAAMMLGLATSTDGLHWTRHQANPLNREDWIEDVMIVRDGGRYVMAAEGRNDVAHWFTSGDGLHWRREGAIDVRLRNGRPIPAGPYGTPTLFKDRQRWLLYYERKDLGVWVAESKDFRIWTNIDDEPVIRCGPEAYDRHAIALNQIVERGGRYFAFYHASDSDRKGRLWTSCLAASDDLIHWTKYPRNPILKENKSSPIAVFDGRQWRIYTMHDKVQVHFPRKADRP